MYQGKHEILNPERHEEKRNECISYRGGAIYTFDLNADLAYSRGDLKGGLAEDVDLAFPHRVDALSAHRGDDGIAAVGEDVLPIGGNEPPLREVRTHLVEGQSAGVVIE